MPENKSPPTTIQTNTKCNIQNNLCVLFDLESEGSKDVCVKAKTLQDQNIFRPPPKSGEKQHKMLMRVPQEKL